MLTFVAASQSSINRRVQLFLYFCKELHEIFALANRSQETRHSNSAVFSDFEHAVKRDVNSKISTKQWLTH